jgi:hypothetical protein
MPDKGSFVFPRENDNIFLIVLERITLEQLHNPGSVLSQGLLFRKTCYSERLAIQKDLLFRKACCSERFAAQEGLLVARIGRGIGPASNYL